MGYQGPERFFIDPTDAAEVKPVRNTFGCEKSHGWTPGGAMKWYDQIIDDMLANPGTDMTATARRLGRHPNTVQTICASDLFQARFAQRRAAFEEELNRRIVSKLTKAAELSLDITIETLEKKRDAIPLPVLGELTKTTLDRLGYSPKSEAPTVTVVNQNNVVSADALAAAREKLKLVEGSAERPRSGSPLVQDDSLRSSSPPQDLVAGPDSGIGEGEEG